MSDTRTEPSAVEKGLDLDSEREQTRENSIQGDNPSQVTPAETRASTFENTSPSLTDPDTTIEEMSPNARPTLTDEPPSERPIERVTTSGEDYSILTTRQKKFVILTASIAALFSPMATSIYCEFSVLTA